MASSEYRGIGASGVNVSNFVSRKLQFNEISDNNYTTWKEQMLCLIESEGLLGFINGEVTDQSQDYAVWRRSDRLVKGWILGALSDEIAQLCVRSETARDVWLKLETKFTQPVDEEEDYDEYSELYKAALRGTWVTARRILEQNPEAVKVRLTSTLETVLHVAVGNEMELNFVANLLQATWWSNEVLALEDRLGRNALHTAAVMGNTAAARVLVDRLRALLYVQDHKGLLPVHLAARYDNRETLEFLMSNTKENLEVDPQADASGVLPLCANPYANASGVLLLCFVIDAEFYDIALRLAEKYPYLARMKDDKSNSWALERISFKELAFPSAARFSFWERLVYTRISLDWGSEGSDQSSDVEDPRTSLICEYGTWHKLVQHFQPVIESLVPILTRMRTLKRMHLQAVRLVIWLCHNMASLKENEARSLYSSAMMRAARLGIFEVVLEIVMTFPRAVDTRRDGHDLFQVAAANRSEYVFDLIYLTNDRRHLYSDMTDSRGNTILHLAARLAPPHKLNLVPGAALQMQRELQWFKRVEKLVHPYARELLNDDGKTAKMVFTEEHKNLKAEGEKWIKDTASSCIIAAALMASVAFAAAITVPGANNSNTGYPMFAKSTAFTIFAISDVVCLFASITSLLVFLSIMTTRYAEEDFLTYLPYILLINLCVNFLSIFCLMITFSASVYLVLGQERAWAMILVSALGCISLISFVLLQVPLVMGVVYSTFEPLKAQGVYLL